MLNMDKDIKYQSKINCFSKCCIHNILRRNVTLFYQYNSFLAAKRSTKNFSFQLLRENFFCKIYMKIVLFFDYTII